MKKLQLYNSLSNSLEDFRPLDAGNIRVYACGPTVYASPHVGNARPLIVFDVLFRVLRKLYPKVTYVRNITDVDDKINARARERNISIRELTDEVIGEFHKNTALLGILPISHEPRATFHIPEMLNIIQKLIDNGFAYESHGHVLFRVRKMANYGMLSKRNIDDMIAGSRVEVAPYKEDPLDFVLWKPSEDGLPAWDSPFGKGRPGWHIECSAMSCKYLGSQFDIHAGGQDLMFPHHENEIAHNFGAFGCIMANYWLHNGMLLVNGQKMSKSLGNIISLDDIMGQQDGEVVRYAMLSSHYQKTLDWTDDLVAQARQSLNRLYGALKLENDEIAVVNDGNDGADGNNPVLEALCTNLNTPLALRVLHEIADKIFKATIPQEINKLCSQLRSGTGLLGFLSKKPNDWFRKSSDLISEEEIEQLIAERKEAKCQKNFQLADEIRRRLLEKNIQIEDTGNGTVWRSIT
jgi:cysteinyl-tRNA synthetase